MLRRIVALAFILSTPAFAQTYDRPDIIRGLCRPDGCDEFAVLGASPVAKAGEGTLMKTRVKTFRASSGGRRELSEENGYVFCSRTRPAILAEKNGRTMAFYIAPFSSESREAVRQNANFHALYFSICHGLEAGRAAIRDLPGVAQNLGYRVALPQSQYVALKRVEDILSPADRRPIEAREDSIRPVPPMNVPPSASQRDLALDERVDEFLERREPMPPQRYPYVVEREDGLLAGPRRLANRAFDALDDVGDWVLGRRY